jgi:hypothetical protein
MIQFQITQDSEFGRSTKFQTNSNVRNLNVPNRENQMLLREFGDLNFEFVSD